MEGQPVQRAWDSDLLVVRRFSSPAYKLPPPDLIGGELMPADVRKVCDWVWGAWGFHARDIAVRRYTDVFVANQGLIIRPVDWAVYVSSISQHTEMDLQAGLRQIEEVEVRKATPVLSGPCILCTKPGGDNYGHWLNEMLSRAEFGRRLGLADAKYLVPAAGPRLTAVIRESLDLIGVPGHAIVPIQAPVRIEELYSVSDLTFHGMFMSPQVLRCLDRIKSRLVAEAPSRIYVTREGRTRKFVEEAGVCEAFRRAGYRVLDPALLDFREQVQAFMGATEVVGCMGAGLANIGFAPPHIPVTVFAPAEMADTFYYLLAGLRRQRYREVRCEVSPRPQGIGPRDHDMLLDPEEVLALALGQPKSHSGSSSLRDLAAI